MPNLKAKGSQPQAIALDPLTPLPVECTYRQQMRHRSVTDGPSDYYHGNLRSRHSISCASPSPQPAVDFREVAAKRLATRLYNLDGFNHKDVGEQLSRRSSFYDLVAREFMSNFNMKTLSVLEALRLFLAKVPLQGESQQRERVLQIFSQHFVHTQPSCGFSEDACHVLTCALLLLNTDLHNQNLTKKITCSQFVHNLYEASPEASQAFSKDMLKACYQSIKDSPIQWSEPTLRLSVMPETMEFNSAESNESSPAISRPKADVEEQAAGQVLMSGYVTRKCLFVSHGKKEYKLKRSWRLLFAQVRGLQMEFYRHQPVSLPRHYRSKMMRQSKDLLHASSISSLQFPNHLTASSRRTSVSSTSNQHDMDSENGSILSGESGLAEEVLFLPPPPLSYLSQISTTSVPRRPFSSSRLSMLNSRTSFGPIPTRQRKGLGGSFSSSVNGLASSPMTLISPEASSMLDCLPLHHCLATVRTPAPGDRHTFVFHLLTSNGAQFLFEVKDEATLFTWVQQINLAAALWSSQPLPCPVGSQKNFHRPTYHFAYTRHARAEQLRRIQEHVMYLLGELKRVQDPRQGSGDSEKLQTAAVDRNDLCCQFLQDELRRFKTYVELLEPTPVPTVQETTATNTSSAEVITRPTSTTGSYSPGSKQRKSKILRGSTEPPCHPSGTGAYLDPVIESPWPPSPIKDEPPPTPPHAVTKPAKLCVPTVPVVLISYRRVDVW